MYCMLLLGVLIAMTYLPWVMKNAWVYHSHQKCSVCLFSVCFSLSNFCSKIHRCHLCFSLSSREVTHTHSVCFNKNLYMENWMSLKFTTLFKKISDAHSQFASWRTRNILSFEITAHGDWLAEMLNESVFKFDYKRKHI